MSGRISRKELLRGVFSAFREAGERVGVPAASHAAATVYPPGALQPEAAYLAACTGCEACVKACPYHCISMADAGDPRARDEVKSSRASPSSARRGGGAKSANPLRARGEDEPPPLGETSELVESPRALSRVAVLQPERTPCRVCADLPCVAACGDGALTHPGSIRQIRMGVAQVDPGRCRTFRGERCDICVKYCPFPQEAIRMVGTRPVVMTSACTGCGICATVCPDRAIVVVAERDLVPGPRVPRDLKGALRRSG